ncbi:hypothetical protein Tco_0003585 [Tanacetum coccineum]
MVDPGKKYRDDSGGSNSNTVIDINDPLYLHSSDTNVFSSNAKLMWDELAETYDKIDCTLLTTEPLPTVKEAFSLLSKDESHGNMHSGSLGVKASSSAFASRYDNKGNSSSFVNRPMDNKKKFNNNNDVRNPNLKNNSGQNVSDVSVSGKSTDTSGGVSHTLTSDQYQRLMSLLNVSYLDITVAHPNRTKAKVNQIGSCKLNDNLVIHDVLVVPGYQVSLLSVSKLAKDNKLSACFNKKDCVIQDSVLKSRVGTGYEKDGLYFLNLGLVILSGQAKQTREPFPLSDHKSTAVGHLGHLDVWGPYKIRSKKGYREDGGTNPSSVKLAVESAVADLCPAANPLPLLAMKGPTYDGGAAPEDDIYISEGENLDL